MARGLLSLLAIMRDMNLVLLVNFHYSLSDATTTKKRCKLIHPRQPRYSNHLRVFYYIVHENSLFVGIIHQSLELRPCLYFIAAFNKIWKPEMQNFPLQLLLRQILVRLLLLLYSFCLLNGKVLSVCLRCKLIYSQFFDNRKVKKSFKMVKDLRKFL